MDKQEILRIISDASETHAKWVEFGQTLIEGINLDTVEEPIKCANCSFTQHLKSIGELYSDRIWFQQLQLEHDKFHQAYSDLYYESHRMYNPKTLEELTHLASKLESQSELLNEKLNEVQVEISSMSDDDFHGSDSFSEDDQDNNDTKLQELTNEISADTLEMMTIDIEQHKEDEVQLIDIKIDSDELKLENNEQEDSEQAKSTETEDAPIVESVASPVIESNNKTTEKSAQHIVLKKLDIEQLKQEKELSELELTHLDDRQKLTQQGVTQLEQYYTLKQEEIEAEKIEHNKLVEFKNNERKQTEGKLNEIVSKKAAMHKEILDLESENDEDELKLQEDQKAVTIKKQFDELKFNKTKDLERLEEHLNNRQNELNKLKEQLALLEQEVAEVQQEIAKKEQDLETICEKEQLKNDERNQQVAAQGKITQQRLYCIDEKQTEIDALTEEAQNTQSELEVIDIQIEDLNKNSAVQDKVNKDELAQLTQQQDEKKQKLFETKDLRASKQREIEEINLRIKNAEHVLDELENTVKPKDEALATSD